VAKTARCVHKAHESRKTGQGSTADHMAARMSHGGTSWSKQGYGAISPAIHNHTITEDFHAIHQDCRTTVGVVRGVLE
jgi:hypothetical protein